MNELLGLDQVLGFDREGNKIIITGDSKYIPLSIFESKFGKSYDYETIRNHENATEMWKKLFDDWKQRGIIK